MRTSKTPQGTPNGCLAEVRHLCNVRQRGLASASGVDFRTHDVKDKIAAARHTLQNIGTMCNSARRLRSVCSVSRLRVFRFAYRLPRRYSACYWFAHKRYRPAATNGRFCFLRQSFFSAYPGMPPLRVMNITKIPLTASIDK